jgi:hypothetical protein
MALRFGFHGADVLGLRERIVRHLRAAGAEYAAEPNGHGADFLIQLDESELPRDVSCGPRYGVWRFAASSPGPLAFWDVYDNLYHLELGLYRNTTDPAMHIPLDRRWIKVDRLSYRRTRSAALDEMARMPADATQGDLDAPAEPIAYVPESAQPPSPLDRARLGCKLLLRNAKYHLLGPFFSETWDVGVVDDPITRFVELDYLPSVRWLPSPGSHRFLADPFLAAADQGLLLLAEDYDLNTGRGKIVQELAPAGQLSGRTSDAIVENCHMSYPFLLLHDGDLYCIPETNEKNGVYAWRWNEAAQSWLDLRAILTDMAVVDPTPVNFEGRWWLFCTDKNDGVDSKLRLFFADSPWGPWTPHARDPVKADIRSSRPGGTPFVHRGRLYRPAQDSSKHYGWRLMLNEVTRISPTEFSEEVVRVLDSGRLGVSGVHTLSGAADKTVIDGRRMRFTPWLAPRILAHKLKRLFR